MKTLRYRIRVIALALVCALLAAVIWTVKSAWFSDAVVPEPPADAVSSVPPDPWADPVPAGTSGPQASPEETPLPAEETPSPEPLFDTTGL